MAAAFAACAVAVSAAISSPAFTSSHGKDSSRLCSLPRPSGMCRGRECGNQQPIHVISSALHVMHSVHALVSVDGGVRSSSGDLAGCGPGKSAPLPPLVAPAANASEFETPDRRGSIGRRIGEAVQVGAAVWGRR